MVNNITRKNWKLAFEMSACYKNIVLQKKKLQLHRPLRELPPSNLFLKYPPPPFHIFRNVTRLAPLHSTHTAKKQKLQNCYVTHLEGRSSKINLFRWSLRFCFSEVGRHFFDLLIVHLIQVISLYSWLLWVTYFLHWLWELLCSFIIFWR